jgi:hypothetical protein
MHVAHIAELAEARGFVEVAAKEQGYVFGLCLAKTSLFNRQRA